MQRNIILSGLFLGIFMITLLVLNLGHVYAVDELFLNGIVKRVDVAKKTVTIDVLSTSCRGIRKFAVEKPLEFEDLEGDRIEYSIDSSTCRHDEIYSMLSYRRVKR